VTTNARTTSISVIMSRSEAFRPQQRVSQVEQQTERDEAGERVIEDHGLAPLEPFASVGIAYACHEEAERERQHDNVQHGMFLCIVAREPNGRFSRFARLRCHQAHKFSRRAQWRHYRNLIKVPIVPALYAIAHKRRDLCRVALSIGRVADGLRKIGFSGYGSCVRRDDRAPYETSISPPLASSRFQMAIWPFSSYGQCPGRNRYELMPCRYCWKIPPPI
jgi:hypothetical protein